jgi:hypothetical protein
MLFNYYRDRLYFHVFFAVQRILHLRREENFLLENECCKLFFLGQYIQ